MLIHDAYEERGREQSEMENRQALRRKDALLDEMNHRTKNTLQVALSLLTMQAQASSTMQVREALLDGAARLHALAKVHELLQMNADSSPSVLMPRLLLSLGDALRQSYGRAHPQVTLEVACDPMELPAQDAVALALFANEAITNAYKHAFPNGCVGAITVELQGRRETAICLRVEDTGIGLAPPDGDKGMGMTLIRSFADQLYGTLDVISRGGGTGTLIALTIAAPASDL